MRNNGTFVKWAGGKSQIVEKYSPYFPDKIERYFEPFVGSGAVFFFVKKNFNPKEFFLSDINEDLIITFKVVRDRVDELIEDLKSRRKNHNKEYFYKVRKEKPTSDVAIASRFIYLNKTCYNGLYRVNSKGEFNVPFGKYRNPQIFDDKILREASKKLKGVKLKVMSFEKILDLAKQRDFIYFDPPYLPISKTSSFTSYTKDGFLEREHQKLAQLFRNLDEKGCFVMLSNSDHPVIRKLYNGFNINVIKARRAINREAKKRGPINELLITNYENKTLEQFMK